VDKSNIDFLFVHVPKFSNYYKPWDEFMFINYIPMGVFAMCDKLNQHGISAKIVHLGLEYLADKSFSIAAYIKAKQIKAVGLSLHWHYQAYDVIEIAKKIKAAAQETKIILGGMTASYFAREIMENYSCLDFIIAGDGERGLLELVNLLKGGFNKDYSQVANCLYRKDGKVIANGITYTADATDISSMDYANLSYLQRYQEYRDYFKLPSFWQLNTTIEENLKIKIGGPVSTFPLMVGRGCTVNCSFCGGGRQAQYKICKREKPVFLPVGKVIANMEQALSYGYKSFIISFDPYPADDSYYVRLCEEIRKRKIVCGMGFESWGLPTHRLIQEFGKTFQKNISYIALSPETASEKLRRTNKGFFYTNDELYQTMERLEAEEVSMMIYMTIGLAGETSRDMDNNYLFIKKLKKRFKFLSHVHVLPVQLEPGSPLFDNPENFNAVTERKTFQDYYNYHQKPDSSPYGYLGYATKALQEAHGDISQYNSFIFNKRCRRYCIIPARVFGRISSVAFSRLICRQIHKRWLRAGYGRPRTERQTFP
jgi:radical SAM superfamily enzyme YgiQ (UPF0313 family)